MDTDESKGAKKKATSKASKSRKVIISSDEDVVVGIEDVQEKPIGARPRRNAAKISYKFEVDSEIEDVSIDSGNSWIGSDQDED